MMNKIFLALLLAGYATTSAFAALKEVVKEASGSGATQHQAISEALLVAVQSVNGATVSSRVDYETTVNMSVSNNKWSYSGKVSPVFSVDNTGSGSVTKFQVLSVTGSKTTIVREYVRMWCSTSHPFKISIYAALLCCHFSFMKK